MITILITIAAVVGVAPGASALALPWDSHRVQPAGHFEGGIAPTGHHEGNVTPAGQHDN
ncbi:hypothetical protein ACFU96_34655 [Streptomyces sp. NPDC057620]|uniref:hypothetical protein n=1 Tax=Streptomyces sp. NPDC057620 TaxID=3346185 RepID=UPI0036AC4491